MNNVVQELPYQWDFGSVGACFCLQLNETICMVDGFLNCEEWTKIMEN